MAPGHPANPVMLLNCECAWSAPAGCSALPLPALRLAGACPQRKGKPKPSCAPRRRGSREAAEAVPHQQSPGELQTCGVQPRASGEAGREISDCVCPVDTMHLAAFLCALKLVLLGRIFSLRCHLSCAQPWGVSSGERCRKSIDPLP